MHVIREADQKPDFIVLTGDGKREFDVLRALGEKYDGRRTLWFPKAPLSYLKLKMKEKPVRLSGQSVYNAIRTYAGKGYCKFLVLYDKEYYEDFNKDKMYLENEVRIQIIEIITLIEDKAFQLRGKFGSRDIEIFISIQGDKKDINEEISRLIRLKYNEGIEPDDKIIKMFLREKGEDVKKLIKNSNKRHLQEAFKGICKILDVLHFS
jgi:hypothetical protein